MPIIPAFLLDIRHEQSLAKLKANQNMTEITLPAEKPVYMHSFRGQARPVYAKDEEKIKCTYMDSETDDIVNKKLETLLKTLNLSSVMQESTTAPATEAAISKQEEQKIKEKELREESTEVGILFASKPVIQAITNPFIGPLTNK